MFGLRRPSAGTARYLLFGAALGACAFVGLVWSLKWKLGVGLAVFAVLLAVNLYSLQLSLLPIFFAIPFDRLGKIGPDSPLTVAKILIAVLILSWGAHQLVKREKRPLEVLLHSPIFGLAILGLTFSFFSAINARDYEIFAAQNLRRVNNFVLFILIATVLDNPITLRRVFYFFVFAYFFVGLTAMYEIHTGESILKTVWGESDTAIEYTLTSGEFRIGGPGGDPDFLAVSTIFPILVSLTLLFGSIPKLAKAGVAVVFLMLVIALLATGSRGGLLAMIVGLTVVWLLTPMKHKVMVALGVGVLLVAIVALLSVATGTASAERYTGEAGGVSIIYRLGWSEMALMMIRDHPFVGIGTGNFPMAYNRYSAFIPEIPRTPFWPHNSFLQTWCENGILALMVYCGVYLAAAIAMLRAIRLTRDPEIRREAVLILAVVCGYFVFAGTSNVLENENYWIAFALATVISYLVREEVARRLPGGGGETAA